MKLYLIRHGESEGNFKKIHTGQTDVPLTEKGRADAENCGINLSGITFDKVYSSDLQRAADTQRIAYPTAEQEVERLSLLREIDVGSIVGKSVNECTAELGSFYTDNRKIMNFKPFGGEDYDDLLARAEQFLGIVEKSEYDKLAAFCHHGFILAVCDVILGSRFLRDKINCDNCGIFVFEYLDGKWKLDVANYTGKI